MAPQTPAEQTPAEQSDERLPRPVPVIGDTTAAAERAADPAGWALDEQVREALRLVIESRRDIRRFRPDEVPQSLVRKVLQAGHAGPSVGHSQPWRFIVVADPSTRDAAAWMADRARLAQARRMAPERAQRLLDLKLEGIREAPMGIVVACDRRTPAAGVLGRATFADTDLWSCAAAIENMWLTARAEGLGMGWVTLFEPDELRDLLGLPAGVETLGWLCLGWPDERPPAPGLERLAWSKRLPLDEVVLAEHWSGQAPPPPPNHLLAPAQGRRVAVTDQADELLSPPGSLGLLDAALNRAEAVRSQGFDGGCLVLVGADHPIAAQGVSAFEPHVTRDVLTASVAGSAMGTVAARAAGMTSIVVDAGVAGSAVEGARQARPQHPQGDLATTNALDPRDLTALLAAGRALGAQAATSGLVALGEVGIGNTTVAAALTSALLHLDAAEAVGLGAGADAAMVERKVALVEQAVARWKSLHDEDPRRLLGVLGGPEFAVLTGVVLGAAAAGGVVVLDGLAASVPALVACRIEPAVQAHLVAGQLSREAAHSRVLDALGLEPLLALRLRAGEGVGASMAASLLLQASRMRREVARTARR